MAKKKEIDYRESFYFPDIMYQPYPVYLRSCSGKMVNFKSIIYPNPTSRKRYTRRKQLVNRSLQAKIFDAIIHIGYFEPLLVYKEFPVPVQNCHRLVGQQRLYYICDYYFPTLKMAVELDSEYHDGQGKDPDTMRDQYLWDVHRVQTFRIRDFQKRDVQESRFRTLTEQLRSMKPSPTPEPLIFTTDLSQYLAGKT